MDEQGMMSGIVVIGGGQAAAQLVDEVRRLDADVPLSLYTQETLLPYQRPPLSKQLLRGEHDLDWLLYRPAEFYRARNVRVVTGARVAAIHRDRRELELAAGSRVPYGRLALATGCRVRRLAVPGGEHVHYIRSHADTGAITAQLGAARRVVVVGGGFIGLETAASLRQGGVAVTLLVQQSRVLEQLAAPEISACLAGLQAAHGVAVHCGVTVSAVERDSSGTLQVLTSDGGAYPADLVVAGIGVTPCSELAEAAGLRVDNGIEVDEHALTSDPDIVAAGDCTSHPSPLLARRLRLETVHNAVEQARVAAATLCGEPRTYAQIPWVWSDQFDCRFQGVGYAPGYDSTVLRGDPGSGRFSVFYFAGPRPLAMHAVNAPREFAAARCLFNRQLAPSRAQVEDPGWDLVTAAANLVDRSAGIRFDRGWRNFPRGGSVAAA